MHWYNLYTTPLCAATQETTARAFWDSSEMAWHVRTSPFTPPSSPSHTFCPRGSQSDLHPWLRKPGAPFSSPASFFAPHTREGCLSPWERSSRQAVVPPPGKQCFITVPQDEWHQACGHLPAHWRGKRQSYRRGQAVGWPFPLLWKNSFFLKGILMNASAFIANNCLVCSFSISPSTGILTVVHRYHRRPWKEPHFPDSSTSSAEASPSPTAAGCASLWASARDQGRHTKRSVLLIIIWPVSLPVHIQWCSHEQAG